MLKKLIKDILIQVGIEKKATIGVSVSPNVGLEVIEIDNQLGVITKYSCRELEYNHSLREVADIGQLKLELQEMFTELEIQKGSNVFLSIPNVSFGMINLPTLLPDDSITGAIISEVEQSYIFKRSEPIVSWADISLNSQSESRHFVYSAIQKSFADKMTEVINELGCNLVGIETSYNTLFRALSYLKITEAQMQGDTSWNLLIVMPNSYAILSMVGTRPVDYIEEPLALKSFVDEDIYNAIKTSAQVTLMGLPANYLTVVSETDLVSAEILSKQLDFDGSVTSFECNKFAQQEFMPVSLNVLRDKIQYITANAIGTGASAFYNYPLKLNFVAKVADAEYSDELGEKDYIRFKIGETEIELSPEFIKKCALLSAVFVLLPMSIILLLLMFVLEPSLEKKASAASESLSTQQQTYKDYREHNKTPMFNVDLEIDKEEKINKQKLTYFSALGYALPEGLWLSYFETDDAGLVDIKGSTGSTQNIYTFYRTIRQLVNDSKIVLKRLELSENSLDTLALSAPSGNKLYQFEITDMPKIEMSNINEQNDENNNAEPIKRKSLFELGQPWITSEDSEPQENDINRRDAFNNDMNRQPGLPQNLQRIENIEGK